MKDPTRLLDASASELELRLLRAGASEQPPAAAMQRLTEKLGAAHSSDIAKHVASTLQPTAANKLSLLSVSIVAAGITLAGVNWVATRPSAPPEPIAPKAHAPAVTPISPQPTAEPSPSADTPTIQTPNPLALEIARIDAIRRLLASDRAKPALAALSDYQRDFPRGVLQQEADVLSIEAHRQAGERRRARALAARFLATHPDSPHSARVRELLALLGPDAR